MLHLIPRPLHRLLLRAAHRLRGHFRRVTKFPLRGVSLIARDDQGRVLLVRHSYGSGQWSLPGGGCGRREDPVAAIRREMREELRIDLTNLEQLGSHEEVVSGAPHIGHIFAAELLAEPVADGREIVEARFFAREAVPPGMNGLMRARLALWWERADRDAT